MEHDIIDTADTRPFADDTEVAEYVRIVLNEGLHLPDAGPGYVRHERAISAIREQRPDLMP